jgi:hypothetical protein
MYYHHDIFLLPYFSQLKTLKNDHVTQNYNLSVIINDLGSFYENDFIFHLELQLKCSLFVKIRLKFDSILHTLIDCTFFDRKADKGTSVYTVKSTFVISLILEESII